jgi:hypothetical protein
MAANLPVTDQFGTVHQVDDGMFKQVTDDGCGDGQTPHHHANNGMGFVTSNVGVKIFDTDTSGCGYGLVGGALNGMIDPPDPPVIGSTVQIEYIVNCDKAPPEFRSEQFVRFDLEEGHHVFPLPACDGGNTANGNIEMGFEDLEVGNHKWFVQADSSNGDEEKSCDKKLRVDKDNEITSKIRCGLKKALGTVIVEIFIRIIPFL